MRNSKLTIRAWVESHRHELPTTPAGLSAFPIPFRTVIVNFVSPELRTALWLEHLATNVGEASTLSPEQQEFVTATAAKLPTLMSAPAPSR